MKWIRFCMPHCTECTMTWLEVHYVLNATEALSIEHSDIDAVRAILRAHGHEFCEDRSLAGLKLSPVECKTLAANWLAVTLRYRAHFKKDWIAEVVSHEIMPLAKKFPQWLSVGSNSSLKCDVGRVVRCNGVIIRHAASLALARAFVDGYNYAAGHCYSLTISLK